MSLNIKNERVHALAREAAARTGQSQTSVIEVALRRYLDQIEAADEASEEKDWAEVDRILADMRRIIRESGGLGMSTDDLYDPETGLPA